MTKVISERGLEFIARFEGYRRWPYNDAASPPNATIGYGHLLHRGPVTIRDRVRYAAGWPVQKALNVLRQDAYAAQSAVNRLVKVNLDQAQFDALVSFTFNVGVSALAVSTALKKLNKGDYKSVPAELLKWDFAGGITLPGLKARRAAEGALFAHGIYP